MCKFELWEVFSTFFLHSNRPEMQRKGRENEGGENCPQFKIFLNGQFPPPVFKTPKIGWTRWTNLTMHFTFENGGEWREYLMIKVGKTGLSEAFGGFCFFQQVERASSGLYFFSQKLKKQGQGEFSWPPAPPFPLEAI